MQIGKVEYDDKPKIPTAQCKQKAMKNLRYDPKMISTHLEGPSLGCMFLSPYCSPNAPNNTGGKK